jgi:hypothetical protein
VDIGGSGAAAGPLVSVAEFAAALRAELDRPGLRAASSTKAEDKVAEELTRG